MLASSFPAAVTGAESSRHGDGAGIWEELGFGRSAAAPGRCALGAAKPRLRARELKPPWDKRGLGVPAHTQGSSDLQGEAKQKLQLLWRPAGSWHRRAGWGGAGLLSRQDAQFGGFDLHREVSSFLTSPCVCSRSCFMYRNCLHSIFSLFFRAQHAQAEPPTAALRAADDATGRPYPTKPRS